MEETGNEIKALINLLDDPNDDVFKTVSENLVQKGPDVIPELEKAWENSLDKLYQERLEDLIQRIQFNTTKDEFAFWIRNGGQELLQGVYLIAKFQFPDLKFSEIDDPIERIKKDVWLELNDNLTALEKVKVLNHIIFEIHKFSKNSTNFYNPQNSFINQVIETKRGNPISLAIIYSEIGQRLGLPIYGVNLPKNFILAYRDEHGSNNLFEDQAEDILFYINPYKSGAVLGKREIDYFLKQQKLDPQKRFYLPCKNLDIVQRVINNLINSYDRLGFTEKVSQFEEIQRLIPQA